MLISKDVFLFNLFMNEVKHFIVSVAMILQSNGKTARLGAFTNLSLCL